MNSDSGANPAPGAAGVHPIGVAARRGGVPGHLLRPWERRYAAVGPVRGPDGARLYTDADVERLRLLRLAGAAGRPIGRLAALPDAGLAELVAGDAEAAPPPPRGAAARAEAVVAAAVEATRRLDGAAAQREMRRAAVSLSPTDFVEHFALPLLHRTGEMWAEGRITAAHEHVMSAALRGVLAWLLDAFPAPAEALLLVAGTPAGHAHEFGAMLACLAAGDEGWRTLYLGPDLPAADIAAAADHAGAELRGAAERAARAGAGPRRTQGGAMKGERAVVVGSGFGGLAAAVRLRAMGYHVTVLEALDQPGGRARVFRRDGFTFDAGPTVITAPYLLDELFALAGRDMRDYLELMPVDPFYRILFADGSRFDYVGDEERTLAQVAAFEPRDVDGYRRLAAHAERIFDVGYTRLADRPFDRPADMLRVLPQMIRLESHRTVYGLVAKYIRDERLRRAFSFEPLLVGGNPFTTTSIYLLIHWLERKWGVHFARGGTTAIVHGLVRLLGEMGVEVRMDAPVAEIVVRNGRAAGVRMEDGSELGAHLVVSNGDPTWTYRRMVPAAHRRRHGDRSLGRRRQSMSLFVAYFGAWRQYPELAHHTIVMGERYRGLLADIFERRVLADDFSLYLHAPTRSDPALAPPGHEAFYVLSPVPNNLSGVDWERQAAPYFARVLEHLERRVLPGIGAEMVSPSFLTPHDFEHTLRTTDGAAFGLEPVLRQSAYFRYHTRSEDVPGLYFVGAGTHPGGGVPGVLNSAKVLERVVPRPAHPLPLPAPAALVQA